MVRAITLKHGLDASWSCKSGVLDRRLDSDVLAYNEADQRILAQREALLQQEMDQATMMDSETPKF